MNKAGGSRGGFMQVTNKQEIKKDLQYIETVLKQCHHNWVKATKMPSHEGYYCLSCELWVTSEERKALFIKKNDLAESVKKM